jgi:hypothetical protein
MFENWQASYVLEWTKFLRPFYKGIFLYFERFLQRSVIVIKKLKSGLSER